MDLNSVLLLPERMKIITYTYINSYVPAFFFFTRDVSVAAESGPYGT